MTVDDRDRGRRTPTYNDMIIEARRSVNKDTSLTSVEKKWFNAILDILQNKGYARVMAKGCLIDIERLADTDRFCSFFDVRNRKDMFVPTVMPVRIPELKNPMMLLYHKKEDVPYNGMW